MAKTMKALLSIAPTGTAGLQLSAIAVPEPGAGEVRVRVRACGLAFPDVLMLEDKYQVRPERPFVPGMEFAGEVDSVGAGVAGFAPGARVFGFVPYGALAEYVIAPAAICIHMPALMPFDHAAGLISTYATAYHALKQRARLQPGETLLVLGAAGGVGLATVQLGKAFGARVIAAVSTEDKLAFAKAQGADDGLIYPRDLSREGSRAFAQQLKDISGGGFDVVCDIVGGAYTEPAVRALAWEGRLLIVGFPAGIAQIPANLLLLKGAQMVGVFCGAFMERDPGKAAANFREVLALYEAGKIDPFVSASFPLDQCAEAIGVLARREAKGKVVVTID